MEDKELYINKIKVKVLKMWDDAPLPEYKTDGSACADLRAYRLVSLINEEGHEVDIMGVEDYFILHKGWTAIVGTGLKLGMEKGWALDIKSRSGAAIKESLVVVNADGKLDCDYRGELLIGLLKVSGSSIRIDLGQNGKRVAQCEPVPQTRMEFDTVESLDDTERGEGGLGHTGSN